MKYEQSIKVQSMTKISNCCNNLRLFTNVAEVGMKVLYMSLDFYAAKHVRKNAKPTS